MDLQHLKTFLTIAKTNSFTQASELLDYAQSSISGQIKVLEEELGIKLFERMGKKVFLTPEGKRLLAYAEKILKLAQEAKDEVSGSGDPKGVLTIGAPESISIYRLPSVLQEYKKRYPQVEIVLRLGACSDIFKWIRNNEVDIGVLMDNDITAVDLKFERLRLEEMVLVSSPDHHLAALEKVTHEDLEGEQLIVIEKDACYRDIFEKQLASKKVQPSSTLEIGSIETIKKCVISGLGVTLLPEMTVSQELSSNLLKDLGCEDLNYKIYTLMLHHKDKWISPTIKAFQDIMKKQLEDAPY